MCKTREKFLLGCSSGGCSSVGRSCNEQQPQQIPSTGTIGNLSTLLIWPDPEVATLLVLPRPLRKVLTGNVFEIVLTDKGLESSCFN